MTLQVSSDTRAMNARALEQLALAHQAKRSLEAIATFCRDHCLEAKVVGDAVEIVLPHTSTRGGPVVMVPFKAKNWTEARAILGY